MVRKGNSELQRGFHLFGGREKVLTANDNWDWLIDWSADRDIVKKVYKTRGRDVFPIYELNRKTSDRYMENVIGESSSILLDNLTYWLIKTVNHPKLGQDFLTALASVESEIGRASCRERV